MIDQFKQIENFNLKYKPISPDPRQRRGLSKEQRDVEYEIEAIKGNLSIHGQEDDVLSQRLRRDGISE